MTWLLKWLLAFVGISAATKTRKDALEVSLSASRRLEESAQNATHAVEDLLRNMKGARRRD